MRFGPLIVNKRIALALIPWFTGYQNNQNQNKTNTFHNSEIAHYEAKINKCRGLNTTFNIFLSNSFQICITFVHTTFVNTMKLEDIIKSKEIPLELKTILNLLYTSNLVQDKTSELLKSYDLSSEQFNVLRILRGQKGVPASLNCVQERMICKMSNTTRLVDKLIAKDMVRRSVCEKNRRKVDIVITKKGMDILKELDGPTKDLNHSIIDKLSNQEAEKLNELLDKIRD